MPIQKDHPTTWSSNLSPKITMSVNFNVFTYSLKNDIRAVVAKKLIKSRGVGRGQGTQTQNHICRRQHICYNCRFYTWHEIGLIDPSLNCDTTCQNVTEKPVFDDIVRHISKVTYLPRASYDVVCSLIKTFLPFLVSVIACHCMTMA